MGSKPQCLNRRDYLWFGWERWHGGVEDVCVRRGVELLDVGSVDLDAHVVAREQAEHGAVLNRVELA